MPSSQALFSTLIVALVLPSAGSIRPPLHTAVCPTATVSERERPDLKALMKEGNQLFQAGSFARSVDLYQAGYARAKADGQKRFALRFLNNLGSAQYQLFRYRQAIKAYWEARELASVLQDRVTLEAICINLSSLYYQLGENDAAMEVIQQGLLPENSAHSKFRPKFLIQGALLQSRLNRSEVALDLLRQAIEESRSQLNTSDESQAWNELGNTLLDLGRLPEAEFSLMEAFRLRKLHRDLRLNYTFQSLGRLSSLRGSHSSAVAFYTRAIESAPVSHSSDVWRPYYERGIAQLESGRLQPAIRDVGTALQYASRWRAGGLPADAFRVSSGVEIHQLYSKYVELAVRHYRESGDRRLAESALRAAEENRAAGLRALSQERETNPKLPPEYWQTLSELGRAERDASRGSPNSAASIRQLRLKIAEIEARAGVDLPGRSIAFDPAGFDLVDRTRAALRSDEVYMTFHLGRIEACVWVISRDGFALTPLSLGPQFANEIKDFVSALRDGSGEAVGMGRTLYRRLFANVPRSLTNKPVWIVAPDGPLFDLPFAALVENEAPSEPVYLVEKHAIRAVPGAWALFRAPLQETWGAPLGLGDPVYNRADPRWPGNRGWERPGAVQQKAGDFRDELPRLHGSAREIEKCAAVWRSRGSEPVLLMGAEANSENLMAALSRNPSVVHVAAHMLVGTGRSADMLALGLRRGGGLDLLNAVQIAGIRAHIGLVVLSGCSSGSADILPGEGLMGLTRAWLVAGAQAVIATRWPADDLHSAGIFQSFYEGLPRQTQSHGRPMFARALQRAQVASLKSKGREAKPSYWASLFCVEWN